MSQDDKDKRAEPQNGDDPDRAAVEEAAAPGPEGDPAGRRSSANQSSENQPIENRSTGERERGQPARGRATAWLALLLALAALVLAARPFWPPSMPGAPQPQADGPNAADEADEADEAMRQRTQALEQRLDSLEQAMQAAEGDEGGLREAFEAGDETLRSELSSLQERIARRTQTAEQRASDVDAALDSLRQRLDRLEERPAEGRTRLEPRIDELERQVADRLDRFESRLARIGEERERAQEARMARLQLAEIDRLVTTARHRLALGDVDTARQAWQWALDDVGSLEGNRYGSLREALRADFERLRDYRPPAREQQVRALLEMAESAAGWPSGALDAVPGDGPDAGAATEPSGWRDRVGGVFSRLVRVESVDPERPRLADVARLRTEVRAKLVTAALALARRDQQLAAELLAESISDIERAFATGDAAVASALQRLRSMDPRPDQPPSLSSTRERLDALLEEDA